MKTEIAPQNSRQEALGARGSASGRENVPTMADSYAGLSERSNYFGTVKSIEGMQLPGEAQK